MAVEVFGKLGVELVAEGGKVGSEEVENFMPVAEPPLTIGRFEAEAVILDEGEGGGVGGGFAGREGDGEKVFGAVDGERGWEIGGGSSEFGGRGNGGAPNRRIGMRRSGERWGGNVEVFGDAAEDGADPEQGFGGGVDEGEDRLGAEGGGELAELGAGELKEKDGGGGGAETLEGGEGGYEGGGRSGGKVELDFDGDSVARGREGEVGREKDTQHESGKVGPGVGGGREKRAREMDARAGSGVNGGCAP